MSPSTPVSVSKVALFVAVALGMVVACGKPAGEGAGNEPASARRSAPRPAPDFALPDLDGKTVRLSDSAGKIRIVDFWATWCAPCRDEIPAFNELYAKYKDKGFEIIAISMDEEGAKVVRPFVDKVGVPYTNLIGNEEVGDAFGGILGYPSAFFVDREGKIVATYIGGVPKRVFETRVREMLGLPPES